MGDHIGSPLHALSHEGREDTKNGQGADDGEVSSLLGQDRGQDRGLKPLVPGGATNDENAGLSLRRQPSSSFLSFLRRQESRMGRVHVFPRPRE